MKSPTFAKALNAMLNSLNGVVINPVEFSGGGTIAGNNIVFGTLAGQWDDEAIRYPDYTMAHEFGHKFQSSDRGNSAWNLNSCLQSTPGLLRSVGATNTAEYSAYNFAQQVSHNVLTATG